jgi:hypothetical protein
MKLKWRNYGLWVALGALVTMGVTDATDITPEKVQTYWNYGLAVLVAAGIVSNPEKGKWFKDEDKGGE